MITANDDFLGHQTSETFSKVATSDTRHAIFTERFWYMGAIAPEGNVVFGLGLGYYPNRRVMDCYAAVSIDNIQHNFRASRQTAVDGLNPAVGPLKIDIAAGLEKHHLVLKKNESGIQLDVTFTGLMHPNDEGREIVERHGRVASDVRRFIQSGRFEGQLSVADRRIDLEPQTCYGFRDRSWGLRSEARTDESTPPVSNFPPILYVFLCAQFETHSLHLFFKEEAPGQFRFISGDETGRIDGAPSLPRNVIKHIDHDLRWQDNPFSQSIGSGRFVVAFADGSSRTIMIDSRPGRLFLKGGLYGGLNGWFQGDDRGALHVDHNRWNLADAADRRVARTLAEQVIEVRDGEHVGFGTIQCGVGAGYPGYRDIQHHPAQ